MEKNGLTISTVFNKKDKDNNSQESKRTIENTKSKEQPEYRIPDVPKPPPPIDLSRPRQPEPISPQPVFTKPQQPKTSTMQEQKERQELSAPPKPLTKPPVTTTRNQAKNNGDITISGDVLKGALVALFLVLLMLIVARLIGC